MPSNVTPAATDRTNWNNVNAELTALQAATAFVTSGNSGTATASGGAATLNNKAGVVTTESLNTAAAANYTLTLTNDQIAAADIVLVTVGQGTNTGGTPVLTTVTPASGSVAIIVKNDHATTAFNGTLKISFIVVKA